MKTETGLSVTAGQGLALTIEQHELGELLQPLIKEIHLFDTCVAGITRLPDPAVLEGLKEGVRLKLQREPGKFDDQAIALYTEDGKKIGYIPERDELIFARLMDAGKLLTACINGMERKGSFLQITIGIYLVDF